LFFFELHAPQQGDDCDVHSFVEKLSCRYTDKDGVANRLAEVPEGEWPYGFESLEVAAQFRAAAYLRAGVPEPPRSHIPKMITFMTAAKGEEVNRVCCPSLASLEGECCPLLNEPGCSSVELS
jgi:hypothetical protein